VRHNVIYERAQFNLRNQEVHSEAIQTSWELQLWQYQGRDDSRQVGCRDSRPQDFAATSDWLKL